LLDAIVKKLKTSLRYTGDTTDVRYACTGYSEVQRTRRGIGVARPFPMIVGFCVPRQKEIGVYWNPSYAPWDYVEARSCWRDT
jgi:hypothetical protein